eukprot:TRINITY_DN74512_c0_g1_i1.p1 TRINITY_DN74512_c0_g1~~TRINITY_DN74512_c0_g1_i1.p1  ORF type:complete len:653 (+),score=96.23 TRINITY_DN74512_c0_g1_i1:63-2021(+)
MASLLREPVLASRGRLAEAQPLNKAQGRSTAPLRRRQSRQSQTSTADGFHHKLEPSMLCHEVPSLSRQPSAEAERLGLCPLRLDGQGTWGRECASAAHAHMSQDSEEHQRRRWRADDASVVPCADDASPSHASTRNGDWPGWKDEEVLADAHHSAAGDQQLCKANLDEHSSLGGVAEVEVAHAQLAPPFRRIWTPSERKDSEASTAAEIRASSPTIGPVRRPAMATPAKASAVSSPMTPVGELARSVQFPSRSWAMPRGVASNLPGRILATPPPGRAPPTSRVERNQPGLLSPGAQRPGVALQDFLVPRSAAAIRARSPVLASSSSSWQQPGSSGQARLERSSAPTGFTAGLLASHRAPSPPMRQQAPGGTAVHHMPTGTAVRQSQNLQVRVSLHRSDRPRAASPCQKGFDQAATSSASNPGSSRSGRTTQPMLPEQAACLRASSPSPEAPSFVSRAPSLPPSFDVASSLPFAGTAVSSGSQRARSPPALRGFGPITASRTQTNESFAQLRPVVAVRRHGPQVRPASANTRENNRQLLYSQSFSFGPALAAESLCEGAPSASPAQLVNSAQISGGQVPQAQLMCTTQRHLTTSAAVTQQPAPSRWQTTPASPTPVLQGAVARVPQIVAVCQQTQPAVLCRATMPNCGLQKSH